MHYAPTDCSSVKRHARRMSNIKDRHFGINYQIWCTLNSDDLEVMHSAMPKRIQDVITIIGGVTKFNMTCQVFARNEISFKIKCFLLQCYTCVLIKHRTNNDLHLLIHCKIKS